MPSGGGSAGGGDGGGGGGGGDSGGGWSSGGDDYYSRRYGYRGRGGVKGGCLWAIIFTVIFVVVVVGVIGTAIGVNRNSQPSLGTDIATNFWAPGESRILSLSSFFCQGGNLELVSNSVDAEVFVLNTVPPLTETNNFTVTLRSDLDGLEFRFWQYHLHPGSEISLSVQTDMSVNVYIVKGNDNANRWSSSPRPNIAVEFFTARGNSNPTVLYQVQEEDEYFVIIHNSFRSATVFVNASATFLRNEYDPPLWIAVWSLSKDNAQWMSPTAQDTRRFLL